MRGDEGRVVPQGRSRRAWSFTRCCIPVLTLSGFLNPILDPTIETITLLQQISTPEVCSSSLFVAYGLRFLKPFLRPMRRPGIQTCVHPGLTPGITRQHSNLETLHLETPNLPSSPGPPFLAALSRPSPGIEPLETCLCPSTNYREL